MADQLTAVQKAFESPSSGSEEFTGPHRRLVDALKGAREGSWVTGEGDIAALLRQVLRHETSIHGMARYLDVPDEGWLPSRRVLQRAGLQVVPLGLSHLRISAPEQWRPSWLYGDALWVDLAISAPAGVMLENESLIPSWSRPETPVVSDPATTQVAGLLKYRSKAQATALRSVVLAPAGSTVHLVLPTGSGKSLVATVPGLLHNDVTTIVIVPTVALALDQERQTHIRFREAGLPPELAYYRDRDPGEKEKIRRRLAEGTQRLIFSSPESVLLGLLPALHQLTRRGGLRYLVIDEAHLVRTWGLNFRPEFQLLAALRTELAQVAKASAQKPPVTVLMTATLSREGLSLNDTLFPGEPSMWIGASFLRTEPRYLIAPCVDEEERRTRLVEALLHLPRPAIVYTTKKQSVASLVDRLRTEGLHRVAGFHGDVGGEERRRILREWSGDGRPTTIDVVIATSAFGLGIDQNDVRSVVHVCVPGSVDRFYQEVGRSGRDGHASVALWMPLPSRDFAEAARIEGVTVIGDEKAWLRWEAMRSTISRDERIPDALILDTSVVPEHITGASDKNRLWNRNTLSLMARAGALELAVLPPPDRAPDESDEEWASRRELEWQRSRDAVAVRLAPDVESLDRTTFEALRADLQDRVTGDERASLARMRELLASQRCWGDIFATEYTFQLKLTDGAPAEPHLSPTCSGCPATLHHGGESGRAPTPIVPNPQLPRGLVTSVTAALDQQLHGKGAVVVWYQAKMELERFIDDLVRRAVAAGVRLLYVPDRLRDHPAVTRAHTWASPQRFVAVETQVPLLRPFPVPTLLLLQDSDQARASWLPPARVDAPRIVVLPEESPDPDKPTVDIAHWRSPSLHIDEFLRRI